MLNVNSIRSLCCVHKSFYNLCSEKNLWISKFREKKLDIIDVKIDSLSEYISEYKKLSVAIYKTNCLINMVKEYDYSISNHILWFPPQLSIDNMILIKDDPIFNTIKDNCNVKNIENYISINIEVGNNGKIDYFVHDTNNKYLYEFNETKILAENYNNIKFIITLISKILYYHPLIEICDINYCALIIHTDDDLYNYLNCSYYDDYDKKMIIKRKEYWDKCYSKYEKLYF